MRIGLVSISDRASSGVYEDKGIPALQDWLPRALRNPIALGDAPDPRRAGAASAPTLRELVDDARCDLVLTTGGTGPAPRDVTPEATLAVADKVMPGFGEQMRQISLHFVPTAILSRQVAVIRGKALIINLPGQPKSIAETLRGPARRRTPPVHGIFAAVPYCIDLIGGPYIETDDGGVQGVPARSRPHAARCAGRRYLTSRFRRSASNVLGRVRVLRHAVARRAVRASAADSFSIACHSSAIWCSWPEALSIRPFIACDTGSSPCVTP